MHRKIIPVCLLLSLSLGLSACQKKKEPTQADLDAAFAAQKAQMTEVAQVAADRKLIGVPACVSLPNEGRPYTPSDIELLPELSIWRFMEREGIAARQLFKGSDNATMARFFVRETFRPDYDGNQYCFGRWAIVDITPVLGGAPQVFYGVSMMPYDVTLRLTKLRSAAWLDSKILKDNMISPKDITEDLKTRAYLPDTPEQLPPVEAINQKLD